MSNTISHENYQQITYTGATKFLLSFISWVGFPMLGISWFINMNNIKSTIIFISSLAMVLIRFYFWIVAAKQNRRLRELKIQHEENEILKQRNEAKEKEVELWERELTVRVTGKTKK